MTANRTLPLWRLLQAAASVVQAVRDGTSATPALAAVPGELRPGAQALVFQALRQLGRAQALRAQLARRPPPPAADALLCTALALAWDPAQAPYEPFTLVNQAVEAAKRQRATAGQASFINACLRRFLRERDALVAATEADPVARWNHPRWWIERLRRDHPDRWEDILRANNRQPPMALRVNARRATPEALQARLAGAGIPAQRFGAYGLQLERPLPVHEIPGFDEGALSVQDGAAQLAAPLLLHGLPAGGAPRLLDACAAPGGKTAHLLELSDGEVTALDVDPARCERIHQTLGRLGLKARVLAADAGAPAAWWDGQPFDAILLDAPCTASGIVRRHPDVRWLRREADIAALAAIQARLLATLWPLLRPGGRMLYCTCSVFKAEGEAQAGAFVAHNTDAVLLPAPGHLLPQTGETGATVPDNCPGDHDGFYYALLEKRLAPRP
ncbi:16S rRNA (cytosine(967)-C(5))-methyltransferase RsmB [Ramlibacter sp. MAHUQ-53]|uniref:16S rRNA (cytosine(967)-C(5))-methyltransferase RsmB n=1 Tax=unclassified Ramlibacter TaxID=2617605 RepID=UPI00362ED3B9